MNIYVASSWRNKRQPKIVSTLRAENHEVYDFRQPSLCDNGFHWSNIDRNWKLWTPDAFIAGLGHPLAAKGFKADWDAMNVSDACVLVLPCGRSAHLEAGWFVGQGRPLLILLDAGGHTYNESACEACGDFDGCHGGDEPELMYKMAAGLFSSISFLLTTLKALDPNKTT